jgi:PPIC-type PPIASE domain
VTPRLRTAPRILASVLALVVGLCLLSACDASPYAAVVNGQVFTQLALNNQLKQYAANPAFVSALSSGNNLSVTGAGGQGTYTKDFANLVLTRQVVDMIVRQHLEATNSLPPPDAYVASRAIWQLTGADYWNRFTSAVQNDLVQQTADLAQLVPASVLASNQATLQQAYAQLQPYLFSQICVDQASAFNLADARAVAAGGLANGTNECYDQTQFEDRSNAYQTTVRQLNVGQVSKPIPTAYGYVVVRVTSRQTPGNTPAVQKAIYATITTQGIPGLTSLVQSAHVKINPAYGTWKPDSISIAPPPTTGT